MTTGTPSVVLVDVRGNPLTASTGFRRPHDAASSANAEIGGWNPAYYSADAELLLDRPALIAKTQDLIRNNGLTSHAVQTHLDWVIGSGLQLNAKPDWLLLGVKDKKKAREWERNTEARFLRWAEDPACYADSARGMRFSEILAQGYRNYLTSFEIVQACDWIDDDPNRPYKTAIQSIDPARVCNPQGMPNSLTLRDGIALDARGAPIGAWVANRLDNDIVNGYVTMREWKFIPRETPWGRTMFIHIYDRNRTGQSRGKNTGVVASLAKMKMHEKLGQVTLQQSILNAMYAAAIESPMDWQSVGGALGAMGGPGGTVNPMMQYAADKSAFHSEHTIRYDGVRIPHLYPGEKLSFQAPAHPTAAFEKFEQSVLRYCAAGWGLTYEQFSQDYSQTNYTGFRAAMLTSWQFFAGRQYFIGGRDASLIYALWLEEAMSTGEVETLPGTPDFLEAKAAWSNAHWIGPGRGQLDPLKEANATKVRLGIKLTTLEQEAASDGARWENILEQTAQEIQYRRELEVEYGLSEGALDSTDPKTSGAAASVDGGDGSGDTAAGDGSGDTAVADGSGDTPAGDGSGDTPPDGGNVPAVAAHGKARSASARQLAAVAAQLSANMKTAATEPTQAVQTLSDHIERSMAEMRERIDAQAAQFMSMMQAQTQAVSETISRELSKPVVPIHGRDGKLIGAQRVNQIERE